MSVDNYFDRQLFSITTMIICVVIEGSNKHVSQGSGFYYNEESPTDPTLKCPQWNIIEKHWLITNRHVVLPKIDGKEYVPDQFTFCFRKVIGSRVEWFPITILKDDLLLRLRLHKEKMVDVAVIDISSYIHEITKGITEKKIDNNIAIPMALSNMNLPQNQPITIDVTSDIVVASYPKGFYDTENKFPIVKSGIVASSWGARFNGLPMFQIDAQLFPGSSGGLVISKPSNYAMIDGSLKYSTTKQFVLLGVYSGEFKWYEEVEIAGEKYKIGNSYGLGNVWYSYLIPDIIKNGIEHE